MKSHHCSSADVQAMCSEFRVLKVRGIIGEVWPGMFTDRLDLLMLFWDLTSEWSPLLSVTAGVLESVHVNQPLITDLKDSSLKAKR